ncbi:MAG: hypothetical protein AMXMBFR64_48700 [Myxococcales bacterium]
MRIQVVTPHGTVLDEDVQEVTVPGVVGELGILPGHLPIITALDIGVLSVRSGSERRTYAVNGGFLEMAQDKVIVVTETAEEASTIDVARAEAARKRAEDDLKHHATGSAEYETVRLALKRAATRLKAARAGK